MESMNKSKSAGQPQEHGAPSQKERAADEINELRKYIGKRTAELGEESEVVYWHYLTWFATPV